MKAKPIENAVAKFLPQLLEVDEALILDAAGVAQALDALRKALDKVSECLKNDDFQEASNLGYADVSSEFIFLQRTLGALQQRQYEKSHLISEVAGAAGISYEEAEPQVLAKLASINPYQN